MNVDPNTLKVSQICPFIGSYCEKYLMFDLKKHRGVIFHDTEEWLGKSHEEFGRFSPEHWELSKLGLSWDPFVQNKNCMSLKFTKELCVMIMKNDTKIEGELTCRLKIDMKNLTNFVLST